MRVDLIAYLLPLGMLVAPLAYYHDSRARNATVSGTNVLVRDCEAAARDKSLVINVAYPPRSDKKAPAVDPQSACKND
jgi:hypothetical protein